MVASVVRTMVVEDHAMVATALAAALDAEADLEVACVTGRASDVIPLALEHAVDVVVLDLRLAEGTDATELIRPLLDAQPSVKVLVLSAASDDHSVARALDAGCHGYLVKDQQVDELVAGVRAVARGEAVFAPVLLNRVLAHLRPRSQRPTELSARELEVLQLLAHGAATDEIAAQLYLSVNTVRNHIQNVIGKLGVHSRLEAVAHGIRAGHIAAP